DLETGRGRDTKEPGGWQSRGAHRPLGGRSKPCRRNSEYGVRPPAYSLLLKVQRPAQTGHMSFQERKVTQMAGSNRTKCWTARNFGPERTRHFYRARLSKALEFL